jgi:hypothetical protein
MSRAIVICLLTASLAVSVDCSAQAPKVIANKLYAQWDQATASNDLSRMLGFVDSSYIDTDQRGNRAAYAEWRKKLEQALPLLRRVSAKTTVEDVQLEGNRMVVYTKSEMHFEFHEQSYGWVPEIYEGSGEDTWERKSGQWKLVRGTTFRAVRQADPNWAAREKRSLDDARDIINCSGGCPYPH